MTIRALIDALVEMAAHAATIRKAESMADYERLENSAPVTLGRAFATRWNGEAVPRTMAQLEPTHEESEAFLAYEREHLGIDRRSGTLRKLN